ASGVSGPGSALLLTGNTLTAGSNITGMLAAARYSDAGIYNVTDNKTIVRTDGKTWRDLGFAAGQIIALSGQTGTCVVQSVNGGTLKVQSGSIAAAAVGSGKSLVIGVVRIGGDAISINGAASVFNGTFNLAVGKITRTDLKTWNGDFHFAIGQQISLNTGTFDPNSFQTIGGQSVGNFIGGQFVVTGFADGGKTLLVTGGTLPAVQNVAGTVEINSPLVVYGDTSQDARWYNGAPDKLSKGDFGAKPTPHEDALNVTFGSVSKFGKTLGTITRTDSGNWTTSGFVPEGLITVDGVLIGTVSQVSEDGKTLTLLRADLTKKTGAPGFDLSSLWASLTNGPHTIVQIDRLGQLTPRFVFPLANPYQYAGNDLIDAHNLYANIPDGQLPTIGFTAYGGIGDDTIIGSQAGDHLAGGSGNDTILGQRGVDNIYGDAGFNVDLITRVLLNVQTAGDPPHAKNLDQVFAGKDLLYGDAPGSTATDQYGDYDDVIIGDHGKVTQDVAGARD